MRTITRDIVGVVILSSDGKVLLGRSDPSKGVYAGRWVIPGGGIEPGETKQQAAIRETAEETGLDITKNCSMELLDEVPTGESEKTLKETGERVHVKMSFNDFVIRLDMAAAASGAHPTEELIELEWFDIDRLATVKLSLPTTELFKKLGYIK